MGWVLSRYKKIFDFFPSVYSGLMKHFSVKKKQISSLLNAFKENGPTKIELKKLIANSLIANGIRVQYIEVEISTK